LVILLLLSGCATIGELTGKTVLEQEKDKLLQQKQVLEKENKTLKEQLKMCKRNYDKIKNIKTNLEN
jgi:hypothetical protein